MKKNKILSLTMAAVMLFSAIPVGYAEDVDYQQGTLVVYGDGDNEHASEQYTVTVPALLKPGQSGPVTAEGTWASNRVLNVTADATVTLTNSIKATDEKVLDVTFLGIAKEGSNTEAVSATETVAVSDISNALFGTWSGKFNYNVSIADNIKLIPFMIGLDGEGEDYAEEFTAVDGMSWAQWLETDYNVMEMHEEDSSVALLFEGDLYKVNVLVDGEYRIVSTSEKIVAGQTYWLVFAGK